MQQRGGSGPFPGSDPIQIPYFQHPILRWIQVTRKSRRWMVRCGFFRERKSSGSVLRLLRGSCGHLSGYDAAIRADWSDTDCHRLCQRHRCNIIGKQPSLVDSSNARNGRITPGYSFYVDTGTLWHRWERRGRPVRQYWQGRNSLN